jgi:DNA mismatch repair protein MutL
MLHCRAGDILEHRRAAGSPGTTADVRDLFHNTPARLRFLRGERSEAAAAVRIVTELALTRPEVAFSCRSDDRVALRTPGGGLADATAAVYGRESGELLVVDAAGDVTVSGLISEPRSHRGNRLGLVVIVNRRRVHNRALVAAVEEAYAGLLPVGRHPFGVVEVFLDPAMVDVNVHPTKREVRLREEGRVFSAVQRACWAALQESRLGAAPVRLPQLGGMTLGAGAAGLEFRDDALPDTQLRPSDWAREPWRVAPPQLAIPGGGTPSESSAEPAADHRLADLSPLHPLAQAADGWLVAESPAGLVLVDPHAAHEKVLYIALLTEGEAAEREGREAASQLLLIDAVVAVEPAQAERATESADLLRSMGFQLEPFGPGLVRCHAVPAAASRGDPSRLVAEVLSGLDDGGDRAGRRRRIAAVTACHAAVRLGERIDQREQARLLDQLVLTPGGMTCPHGRPTVIVLDDRSLRRAFGRPVA